MLPHLQGWTVFTQYDHTSQGTVYWIGGYREALSPNCACISEGGRKGRIWREECSHIQREAETGDGERILPGRQDSISALPGLTAILAQDALIPNAEPLVLLESISVIFHHIVLYRTASLGPFFFIYRYKMGYETWSGTTLANVCWALG